VNICYLTPPSRPLYRSRRKNAGASSTTLQKSRNSSRQTDAGMNRFSYREPDSASPIESSRQRPGSFRSRAFYFSESRIATTAWARGSQCAFAVVAPRILNFPHSTEPLNPCLRGITPEYPPVCFRTEPWRSKAHFAPLQA